MRTLIFYYKLHSPTLLLKQETYITLGKSIIVFTKVRAKYINCQALQRRNT